MLPSPSDLPVDFGRYTLTSVLGEGGMARVYLAELSGPRGFSKQIAMKIVKRKAGKKSEFVSLLTREAVIGSFLSHANIVVTFDFAEVGGHYFISMEYVDGNTLEELMRAANRQGPGFPPTLALDLVQQVCRGLHYAHALCDREGKPLKIIHRDIKPANIMISKHGVAKITDFGIAKAAVETGVVTATNVVRGTPLYMSPEQATGRSLDHRSDLFSVGLILYEALTGKRLFEMRDIVSTMENIARANVGTAPEELDAIVPGMGRLYRKLMQLHPAARHADAGELEEDLAELNSNLSPDADMPSMNASLRQSLHELSTSANSPVHVRPTKPRTPTEPDTKARIPVDLRSLNELDSDKVRELVEQAAAERAKADRSGGMEFLPLGDGDAVEDADIDRSAETIPYLDPVIRRTNLLLKAVLADCSPDGEGGEQVADQSR